MKIKKHNQFLVLMVVGILVLSVLLSGCSKKTIASAATNAPVASSATSPNAASLNLAGTLTESGSTTVQPLAEKLANAFTAANPGVKIVIQGGGTATGIKAANDGTVDLGASSRELTSNDPALQTFLLARDGIAIIVHPSNPVSDLTKNQIIDIFSGKITNWKDVGGPDKDIHVAAREEGSGTRTAFQEMVMGKDAAGNVVSIVKNAILQSSSGAILQVVKSDAQAISFDSFGYIDSSVKALSIGGIAATSANAKNGTYPVIRPLYFLTKNAPAGLVKAFLDYCNSADAQKIVSSEGYISVK
jgi:phosphate transport system substrate-binding protein